MTRLYILVGPDKGRSFDLEGDSIYIGRSLENEICIRDKTVSRRHLKLTWKEGRYFITDLRSVNRTFHNGNYVPPGIEIEAKEGVPIAMGMSVICIGQGCIEQLMPLLDTIELDGQTSEESGIFREHRDRTNQKKLEMIYKVSNVLTENLSVNATLGKILEYAFELLGRIDRGAFILFDPDTRKVTHLVSRSNQKKDDPFKRFCKDVVKRVARNKIPFVISNVAAEQGDELLDTLKLLHIQSVMCVPLISSHQIIGVFYVDSLDSPYGFRREDISFFLDLSQRTAVALDIARFANDLPGLPEQSPSNPIP